MFDFRLKKNIKPKTHNYSLDWIENKSKVEKILKGSLHSIPSLSPSVKIQIMGRKVFLMCKGKTTFENKKFVDITQQCFAFFPQVNFPANNLNFHWRWWDQVQAIFLIFFLLYDKMSLCGPDTRIGIE